MASICRILICIRWETPNVKISALRSTKAGLWARQRGFQPEKRRRTSSNIQNSQYRRNYWDSSFFRFYEGWYLSEFGNWNAEVFEAPTRDQGARGLLYSHFKANRWNERTPQMQCIPLTHSNCLVMQNDRPRTLCELILVNSFLSSRTISENPFKISNWNSPQKTWKARISKMLTILGVLDSRDETKESGAPSRAVSNVAEPPWLREEQSKYSQINEIEVEKGGP